MPYRRDWLAWLRGIFGAACAHDHPNHFDCATRPPSATERPVSAKARRTVHLSARAFFAFSSAGPRYFSPWVVGALGTGGSGGWGDSHRGARRRRVDVQGLPENQLALRRRGVEASDPVLHNSLPYVDRRMPRAAAGVGTRFHRAAAQGDARSSTTPLNSG